MCVLSTRERVFREGRGRVLPRAHSARTAGATDSSVRLAHPKQKMGLEKEKSETSVIMDEDEFNRSIEPILGKKPKVYSEDLDRDPKDINLHLKVGDNLMREILLSHIYKILTNNSCDIRVYISFLRYIHLPPFTCMNVFQNESVFE